MKPGQPELPSTIVREAAAVPKAMCLHPAKPFDLVFSHASDRLQLLTMLFVDCPFSRHHDHLLHRGARYTYAHVSIKRGTSYCLEN